MRFTLFVVLLALAGCAGDVASHTMDNHDYENIRPMIEGSGRISQ